MPEQDLKTSLSLRLEPDPEHMQVLSGDVTMHLCSSLKQQSAACYRGPLGVTCLLLILGTGR